MFCQKCGKEIGDGMRFCGNCGAPTTEAVTTEAAVPCEQTMTPVAEQKKNSEFAEKIKTTAKAIFNKIKGSRKLQIAIGAGLLVFIALIVLLFSTVLCGGAGAKKTLEKYVEAQRTLDKEAVVELVPDSLFDYRVKKYMDGRLQLSKEDATKNVRESYDEIFLLQFDVRSLDESHSLRVWYDRGYADKANINILNTYTASGKEVRELNSYIENKYGFDFGATQVVLFYYELDFIVNGEDTEPVFPQERTGICVKCDGEWCYLDPSYGLNWQLYSENKSRPSDSDVQWVSRWIWRMENQDR